jgi:hypothetical protein
MHPFKIESTCVIGRSRCGGTGLLALTAPSVTRADRMLDDMHCGSRGVQLGDLLLDDSMEHCLDLRP